MSIPPNEHGNASSRSQCPERPIAPDAAVRLGKQGADRAMSYCCDAKHHVSLPGYDDDPKARAHLCI